MKNFRIILFFTFFLVLCGFNIFTDSVMQSLHVRVRLTKRIKIPYIVSGLNVELFLPTNYTNGVNMQKISGLKIGTVVGGITSKKIFTDRYGNKKIKITFKNPIGEIFIDYAFTFSSRVKPIRNQFPSKYPLSVFKLQKMKKFLCSTDKVQLGNVNLKNIVNQLSNGQNKAYKVV